MVNIFVILIFLLFFLLGLEYLFRGLNEVWIYLKFRRISPSKISTITTGLVKVIGKGKTEKTLFSPLSGTKCIWWKVTCIRLQLGDGGYTEFVDESSDRFFVEDGTGKISISPKSCRFEANITNTYRGMLTDKGEFIPIGKSKGGTFGGYLHSKLKKGNLIESILKFPSLNDFRLTEDCISDKDTVQVIGTVEKASNLIVSNEKSKLLFIGPSDGKNLPKISVSIYQNFLSGLILIAFFGYAVLRMLGIL